MRRICGGGGGDLRQTMQPLELAALVHGVFSRFDAAVREAGLFKMDTVRVRAARAADVHLLCLTCPLVNSNNNFFFHPATPRGMTKQFCPHHKGAAPVNLYRRQRLVLQDSHSHNLLIKAEAVFVARPIIQPKARRTPSNPVTVRTCRRWGTRT